MATVLDTFLKAYEGAAKELEALLDQEERIEARMVRLRQTMNALATQILDQAEREGQGWMSETVEKYRGLIAGQLTNDIHNIVLMSPEPVTMSEIRHELKKLGSLEDHSNPLATISSILSRLSESDRVKEVLRDGRKAWTRTFPRQRRRG